MTTIEKNIRPPLSSKEIEVLILVAQGKTNLEIADELSLSLDAIRSRLKKIYEKLEVRNRTEAVTKAFSTQRIYSK